MKSKFTSEWVADSTPLQTFDILGHGPVLLEKIADRFR